MPRLTKQQREDAHKQYKKDRLDRDYDKGIKSRRGEQKKAVICGGPTAVLRLVRRREDRVIELDVSSQMAGDFMDYASDKFLATVLSRAIKEFSLVHDFCEAQCGRLHREVPMDFVEEQIRESAWAQEFGFSMIDFKQSFMRPRPNVVKPQDLIAKPKP